MSAPLTELSTICAPWESCTAVPPGAPTTLTLVRVAPLMASTMAPWKLVSLTVVEDNWYRIIAMLLNVAWAMVTGPSV